MHQLLKREFGKDDTIDLMLELETFVRDVRKYESQSGKVLDADIKMSVVSGGMVNAKVRDHIDLNATRLDTYGKLRDGVRSFATARRRWSRESMGDPMQVGAFGKGKDKDEKGEGKGKNGKKGGRSRGGWAQHFNDGFAMYATQQHDMLDAFLAKLVEKTPWVNAAIKTTVVRMNADPTYAQGVLDRAA